jgi:hypothetical protein
VKPLLGKAARLEVLPGSVNLGPASDEDSKKAGKAALQESVKLPPSSPAAGAEGWSGKLNKAMNMYGCYTVCFFLQE